MALEMTFNPKRCPLLSPQVARGLKMRIEGTFLLFSAKLCVHRLRWGYLAVSNFQREENRNQE
jgi:hypothetical protein